MSNNTENKFTSEMLSVEECSYLIGVLDTSDGNWQRKSEMLIDKLRRLSQAGTNDYIPSIEGLEYIIKMKQEYIKKLEVRVNQAEQALAVIGTILEDLKAKPCQDCGMFVGHTEDCQK